MKLCPKCQKQFSDDANFCPVDAARLVPLEGKPEAAVDPLTQRFQLGPALGGSRTGPVHRAVDRQTGAAAIVKIISPAVVALPGVAQRIERELKQLERVQSVGVAHVLASGRRGEDWWVATEMVEGAQTLEAAITARGPLQLEDAAHLIEVIGEALIEAAQVGVVHRDLAPKNVLFAGGDIKLINFSVPVPTDRTPGVPEFVAPEQVEGKAVDQRSNLYSLGALYYYVLTGQPVHAGPADEVHRAHVNGSIRTPSSLAPVPGPIEAVIMRALDKSPTKRFLTVRQFVDEVGRVARGETSLRSTAPMGKAGRPRAELVQTLLGVRGSGLSAAVMQATAQAAAQAAAKAGGSGAMAPLAAAPAAAPAPFMPPGAVQAIPGEPPVGATMHGLGSGAIVPPAPERHGGHGEHAAAAKPAPIEAPPMVAPVAAAPVDRSPWSSPPGQPAAAQASQAQAPAPAAASVPKAPVVASASASSASATGSHKKKKDDKGKSGKSDKSKFRETLWFKKGELDAQAAEERAKSGRDTGSEQADSLPMDERYKDDGSLSHGDKEKYSLRTGGTEMLPRLRDASASGTDVSADELIGEMKAGRGKILALVGLAVIVLILIVVFLTR
jgi:hypothetical protein